MLSKILILTIKLYRKKISPILSKWISCRFYPTCSQYAIIAIEKYGLLIGVKKTFNRLKRCNKYNLDSCIDYP